jgi:isoquinoline 1-oxidoreductase beta subunit
MTTVNAFMATSRRSFLLGSAGLTVAVLSGGVLKHTTALASTDHQLKQATAWVRISTDGTVVISIGSTEMGQGIGTAQPIILAEELDADWSRVKVKTETHDGRTYGNPRFGGIFYTAGSNAMESYYDTLRKAGATARRILVYTAANVWGVAPQSVDTRNGVVIHPASGRQMSYGDVVRHELVADVPEVTPNEFRAPSDYRLVGHEVGRLDVPAKSRGAEVYTIDVHTPGLTYAAVLRAPVEGESPVSIDDKDASSTPGVVGVVTLPEGVAVVAERWETATSARNLLKVVWSRTSPMRNASSDAALKQDLLAVKDLSKSGITFHEKKGDPVSPPTGASILEASYATEPVYHAQMEPLTAVASVDADGKGAEIWFGTQSQTLALVTAASVLGTTPDRIRFNWLTMGGGFGRRTYFARELLRDALILSRELKRPVKLIWTREDDVRNGWFRPTTAHHLRASLDKEGRIFSWHHRVAAPSVMEYYSTEMFTRANRRDPLVMEGSDQSVYAIPGITSEHIVTARTSRIAAVRGIGSGHNAFATESFVDQLAAKAQRDPAAFRRLNTAPNSRARSVLDAVVAMSSFGKAPNHRAHGIALSAYRESVAAGVAEISLDRETGKIHVHRFWAAYDAGRPVQPRNLDAQIEGGIVFGLSMALKESISVVNGEVQQNNFYDYPIFRQSETPEIFVRSVASTGKPSSAGELSIPITAAAVANAFHSLTGRRLHVMPFSPQAVLQALKS